MSDQRSFFYEQERLMLSFINWFMYKRIADVTSDPWGSTDGSEKKQIRNTQGRCLMVSKATKSIHQERRRAISDKCAYGKSNQEGYPGQRKVGEGNQ